MIDPIKEEQQNPADQNVQNPGSLAQLKLKLQQNLLMLAAIGIFISGVGAASYPLAGTITLIFSSELSAIEILRLTLTALSIFCLSGTAAILYHRALSLPFAQGLRHLIFAGLGAGMICGLLRLLIEQISVH